MLYVISKYVVKFFQCIKLLEKYNAGIPNNDLDFLSYVVSPPSLQLSAMSSAQCLPLNH